ncbi:thermostable hemolysin [Pseudomonas sp. RL_15y_Pfl2_60]|uniref:thermostable hemolysin n=1 Tax=Pseudomonas sp. RL_15y_Pfl2_60 TaxID=3088709 RepID=UPI0030D8B8BD
MDLPWTQQDQPIARIGRDKPLNLFITHADSVRRPQIEAFIQQRFAQQYAANVHHFMPCLFGLESESGELLGAVGLRSAAQGPLFLERYLGQQTETVIAQSTGTLAPTRKQLVEVGNLAANSAGAARLLIVAITDLLVAMGFRWVTFTSTPALLNSFLRLGLTPLALGPADPKCMGDELVDWGSYYESNPQVMAGDIFNGHQRLMQLGAYPRLGHKAFYALEEMPNVACS